MTFRIALATALCLAATTAGIAAELSFSDKLALRNSCGKELQALCGEVQRGEGRGQQCIADNLAKFSAECTATLDSLREKLGLPPKTETGAT
jgi:hypothetical protein